MADAKPAEQPEGKETVAMPVVPAWAIKLTETMQGGFAKIDADLETVKAEGQRTGLRLTRQEVRMDEVETRLANNSIRAKSSTEQDKEVAAQLAQERAAREALAAEHAKTKETVEAIATKTEAIETKTDAQTLMLGKITGILDKPLVKKIGYAAGVLLLAVLTAGTGYLARGNVQAPQPTIIQLPPVHS